MRTDRAEVALVRRGGDGGCDLPGGAVNVGGATRVSVEAPRARPGETV
ncbi:hypothetical protein [Deinococcus aestuarii]|nr:hypothetical protein [Deinococcus aestuarii]